MNKAFANQPRADYDSMEGWNSSLLKAVVKQTPAHAYEQFFGGGERKDTPQFRIGTMLHERILEPDVFALYELSTHGSRTKAYAEDKAKALAAGKPFAASDEYGLANEMGAAVERHPVLKSRFTTEHQHLNELSLQWQSPYGTCKARLDALRFIKGQLWIGDLKTTVDAGWDSFGRASVDYLYLLQAAFYADGAYECRRDLEPLLGLGDGELEGIPIVFEFIAIEKTPPFQIARYQLTDEQASLGRRLYEAGLAKCKAAKSINYWSGYDTAPQALELPFWAERAIERMLGEV